MKRLVLCAGLFIGVINLAEAQTKSITSKKAPAKTSTTRLESTSTNQAKAPTIPNSISGWQNSPTTQNSYQISDPILRTLNARANGASTNLDFKEFMGVGRGSYGVANGLILLRSTGSTTSGGITGTGSVGSGSSTGSAGIHGTVPTVNGKNPYAGPSMWGTTGTGIGTDFRQNETWPQTLRSQKKN